MWFFRHSLFSVNLFSEQLALGENYLLSGKASECLAFEFKFKLEIIGAPKIHNISAGGAYCANR